MGNTHEGAEWHQPKTREYFNDCFDNIYNPFQESSQSLIDALLAFVNDENHTGTEAESSKTFVDERQIQLVYDTISCISLLQSMMQGGGCDNVVSLLDDFTESLSEDDTAILKTDHLDKIIGDFAQYNTDFRSVATEVKTIHDEVESIASSCDVIKKKVYTDPDPETLKTNFDDFTNEDKTAGFVPEFQDKFNTFLDDHDEDITGSDFENILETIVSNLTEIKNGIGNGDFDITRYDETKDNIKWTNVKDVLSEAGLTWYEDLLASAAIFFLGFLPTCLKAIADPVIANNGNYINEREDITLSGKSKLSFKRYYNALSERKGSLGTGWTSTFDERLFIFEDRIKALYPDGREGIYVKCPNQKSKDNVLKREDDLNHSLSYDGMDESEKSEDPYYEEVFIEIHGEPGVLKKSKKGYDIVTDDGVFRHFDENGLLSSVGDNNGVRYEVVNDVISVDEKELLVPRYAIAKNGEKLNFYYNKEGLLHKVSDHTGRTVTYEYEDGHLTEVTYPDGTSRGYNYTDDGVIGSVITPNGAQALINEYDEKKRVTRQQFQDGGEILYSYNEEEHYTEVVEQNGCKVRYYIDELGRHIRTYYVDEGIEEKYTYNERNLKTSVTDKNGVTTKFTYDNAGRITGIICAGGVRESFTYDSEGRLTSRKDAEGNKYKYAYGLDGNLYCVTDPLGNRTRYDYEDGKLIAIRNADNKKTILTHDANGNVKTVTDISGVTTEYEYDDLGRCVATIDALGNRTEYAYSASDNIESVIDPLGNLTRYIYDKAGNLTDLVNPDGSIRSWKYNEIGKPSEFVDEEGRKTKVFYNTSWDEEKIILPNSGVISYTYDKLGRKTSVTDSVGRKTSYTYDNNGNILKTDIAYSEKDSESGSHVTRHYTYDAHGQVLSETDGNGNITRFEYDRNGNLVKRIAPNGGELIQEFDALSRISRTVDEAGNVTTYEYDNNGNLVAVTDPAGAITRNNYKDGHLKSVTKESADGQIITIRFYEHDSLGRVCKEKRDNGEVYTYERDAKGQIIKAISETGRVIEYSFDPCGRIESESDCGDVTYYEYTKTGKLKAVITPDGGRTEYTYNELDLLASVRRLGTEVVQDDSEKEIDAEQPGSHNERLTLYKYDLSGQLINVVDALGNSDKYSYDLLGNISARLDRDGNRTVYTRDGNGNITGIDYADGETVRMKYDVLNVLKEVQDSLGLTKINSDILGRIIGVTTPNGESVGYEYDAMSQRAAIIYPDGAKALYHRDELGNLTSLSNISADGIEETIGYEFDANSRLIKKSFPNGTSTSYDYYKNGLLKSLVSTDAEGILDRYEYGYNKKGYRTRIDRARRGLENVSGTFDYDYDVLGRLKSVARNGQKINEYEYDNFGNRVSEESLVPGNGVTDRISYSYDVLDRLISRNDKNSSTSYDYDNRGNLILEKEILSGLDGNGVGNIREYQYDARNYLKSITDLSGESLVTTSCSYNFAGQRVSKNSALEKIEYLTDITRDHYNILRQSINGSTSSFVYDGNVVSVNNGSDNYYYQLDELGSAVAMTGTDGAAFNKAAFDPFGKRLEYTKNGNIISPFAFTGYVDDGNGLYYAQARQYNPGVGRFISQDRVKGIIEFPGSLNNYQYCFNDPVRYVDLNGAWPSLSDIGNAVSGAVSSVKEAATNAVNTVSDAALKFGEEHPVLTKIAIGVAATAATVAVSAAVVAAAPVVLGAMGVGAVGGAIITATAAGAVSAAAGNVVTQGLTMLTDKNKREAGFDWKSLAVDTAIGGVTGFISSGAGALKAGANIAKNATGTTAIRDTLKTITKASATKAVAMTTAGVSSAAYSCYNQYTETGTIDPVKVFWDTAKGVAVSYLTYVGMEWATGQLRKICPEGAAAATAASGKDTKKSGDADGDGAATSNKKSKGNSTAPADVDENGNSNKNNAKSKNNQAENTGDVDNQQAENADSKSSGKGTNKAANKSGNEAPTTTTDGDEASKGNKGTSKNHATNTGDVDNQQAENTDSKSSGKNTNKAANKSTSEAPANTTDGNDAPKENKGTSKNHAANNADADNHQTEHTDSKSSGNGANKTTTKPANETPVATADGDDTHKTSSGSSKSQSTNKVNIEKQQVEGSNSKSTSSSTSKVANETHAPATGSGETSSHNGSSGAPGSHTTSGGNVEKQHVESTSTKSSGQSTSRTPSEVPVAPIDSDDISVGNKGTSKGDSTKATVPKQNADINENVGMEQAKTTPENKQHVNNVEETKVNSLEKTNQNQNTQKNTNANDVTVKNIDSDGNVEKGRGDYSNIPDSKSVGAGKRFTAAQKKKIIQQNMERNGGVIKSDLSGETLVPATKSQKGVTPDPLEVQIDHIKPRSKGGTNSYSNAQVLSRAENIKKSDK